MPLESPSDVGQENGSPQGEAGTHSTQGDVSEPNGRRDSVSRILAILGPGVVTGASDDDPSGIATYSVAGAQFGYQTVWASLVTYPLSAAVQEVCARIGLVSGHGLAAVIKHHYARWVLYIVSFLLMVANTINIGADIEAMADSISLVLPSVPSPLASIFITLLTLALLVRLSYKTYARYLKWTALVLFSYVFVAFLSNVDWGAALSSLIVPAISLDPAYITTLVAILGTTISPYMYFWQASQEVEEEIASGVIPSSDPEMRHPHKLRLSKRTITDMRIDVNVGMFYSELIMFFIIVSTAATIHASGAKNVSQLDLVGLASVLRPLAGDAAFFPFAFGIVGIGLLAVPVLAGSTAYVLAETFGWREGLNRRLYEARGFYAVIVLGMVVGLMMDFIGVSPVSLLYYTAVINGVVAVPLLVLIFLIGNNKAILGEHTSGRLSNGLMLLTILLMGAAAVGLFVIR